MHRRAALCAVAALACGTEDSTAGDPFPILIDRAGGALLTTVSVDGAGPVPAVIDVMSPLTIVDAPLGAAVRRRGIELTVLGHRTATDPTLIARARFSTTALFLHPCDVPETCAIGQPGAPTEISVVIGGDTLRGDALRVQPASDRLFVLPDVAGAGAARDRVCDAEVPSPFYGGGTLVIGGTELGFSGLRPTLGVCLSPTPTALDPTARGVDAALVLSTGIGPSILAESRYEIWRAATGGPALADLAPATVLLPSGPLEGRLARIDALAIVGAKTAPRGACREVFAHHLLTARDCAPEDGDDCPCTDATFCSVPSVVELADQFEALIVPDTAPLLQALRTELRPAQPEIDGVLGLAALGATEFDVDYPNNRLLFRCAGAGCVIRPALRDAASRPTVDLCLAQATPALDAGVDAP
ncbi:MAG: hypothetical protein IPL61_16290 [Myxococcales bacterium]|nr:hypothetical protein [Myxococcales bacterium]